MKLPRSRAGRLVLAAVILNEIRGAIVVAIVTAPLWKGWFC